MENFIRGLDIYCFHEDGKRLVKLGTIPEENIFLYNLLYFFVHSPPLGTGFYPVME